MSREQIIFHGSITYKEYLEKQPTNGAAHDPGNDSTRNAPPIETAIIAEVLPPEQSQIPTDLESLVSETAKEADQEKRTISIYGESLMTGLIAALKEPAR